VNWLKDHVATRWLVAGAVATAAVAWIWHRVKAVVRLLIDLGDDRRSSR
jgi:hypothetical protein